MNVTPTAFLEIEHKFVVDERFEREALFAACRALEPEREKALTVTDTYYVPPGQASLRARTVRRRALRALRVRHGTQSEGHPKGGSRPVP